MQAIKKYTELSTKYIKLKKLTCFSELNKGYHVYSSYKMANLWKTFFGNDVG